MASRQSGPCPLLSNDTQELVALTEESQSMSKVLDTLSFEKVRGRFRFWRDLVI